MSKTDALVVRRPDSNQLARGLRNTYAPIGLLDIAAFLIPLTRFVEIEVVGRLFLSDLLLVALLPVLIVVRETRLFRGLPATFLVLASLWLVGQVVTDLIRETQFQDYARGWALIGFTILEFAAVYLLMAGRSRRIVFYAIGLAVGGLIEYVVNPDIHAVTDPWKFGYGLHLTWLLVLIAVMVARRRRRGAFWATAVMFSASILNFILDFRSLGGMCFLTAVFLAVQARRRRGSEGVARVRPGQIAGLALVASVGAWGAMELYIQAAYSGLLGKDAQLKYEMQAGAGGVYGLLLGGRGEIVAAGQAILDSPLLGHGSWARNCRYTDFLREMKEDLGYFASADKYDCLIPAHSYIFGSWVWAGILGAVFWAWVLTLPVRMLTYLYPVRVRFAPLVVFFAFFLIWDIFFSPYGSIGRLMSIFQIVVVMIYLEAYRPLRGKAQVARSSTPSTFSHDPLL